MKRIPIISIIVIGIIILALAGATYAIFFSSQQEPALTSADINAQQQRLNDLNAKHDVPAQWKEGYAQAIGSYQGYEVIVEFLCFGQNGACPDQGSYYLVYRNVDTPLVCGQLQGTPMTYASSTFIGCGVTQGLSAHATTSPVSGQYTLEESDTGGTFQYSVTSRFDVILDSTIYQPGGVTCSPQGILGPISNIPSVAAPLFAQRFEALAPGTCTLSDGNFSATIQVQ